MSARSTRPAGDMTPPPRGPAPGGRTRCPECDTDHSPFAPCSNEQAMDRLRPTITVRDAAKLGYNYVIEQDGTIYQVVDLNPPVAPAVANAFPGYLDTEASLCFNGGMTQHTAITAQPPILRPSVVLRHADGARWTDYAGRTMVVIDGWNHSVCSTSGAGQDFKQVSCFRANSGHPDTWEKHPTLDGQRVECHGLDYDQRRVLDLQFKARAYEAGVLGFWFYKGEGVLPEHEHLGQGV